MKYITRTLIGMILLSAFLTGCTTTQYAMMLIKQDTTQGKVKEEIVGLSDQLLKSKRISAARVYTMPDGVKIDVWVYKHKSPDSGKSRGTVLVLHDIGNSKADYRVLAKKLAEKGFDVVLPDLRAHGRSTGKYVTFGAKEKHDQKYVIDQLLKEKLISLPIFAFGFDLGGAVAIQYAAIDPRVNGVIAVAPNRDIFSFCRRLLPLLNEADAMKVIEKAGKIAKFDPADASAIVAATKLKCPIILMHGQLDMTVPVTDSKMIYESAAGQKELNILPMTNHITIMFLREDDIVKSIERLADGKVGLKTGKSGK